MATEAGWDERCPCAETKLSLLHLPASSGRIEYLWHNAPYHQRDAHLPASSGHIEYAWYNAPYHLTDAGTAFRIKGGTVQCPIRLQRREERLDAEVLTLCFPLRSIVLGLLRLTVGGTIIR